MKLCRLLSLTTWQLSFELVIIFIREFDALERITALAAPVAHKNAFEQVIEWLDSDQVGDVEFIGVHSFTSKKPSIPL